MLISLSTPLTAAKINIHVTLGGPFWAENGSIMRLPNYVGSTPAPLIEGTDILDCHAIAQENPDYLKTTEAGALCNAIAQLQKHIKDPVELDIEFLFGDATPLGFGSSIAASYPVAVDIIPDQNNKNEFSKGYNSIISQLKKKNANDSRHNPLIAHLPNYQQLNAILPDHPYYQNNPDYPNGKWKPSGVSITPGQLKALGIKPNFTTENPNEEDMASVFVNDNLDVGFIFNQSNLAINANALDLDMSDGLGIIGPLSKDVYNAIDFTNPATWPPGFNTISPKFITDFQGVIIHEVMHGLGFSSYVGSGFSINVPPPVNQPMEDRVVRLFDLFRMKNQDAALMNNLNDFRDAPRFWSLDQIPNRFCNPDLGTAVLLLDFNKEGFYSAPLSNGSYAGSVAGDGRQASHFRTPYKKVPRPATNDCNTSTAQNAKSYFFFEDPPGRLMRPAQGFHNPNLLTNDDLAALDLIGWDIDYNGNQPTVLDPYNPLDLNSNLIPQAEFERANGVQFKKKTSGFVTE